MSVSSSVSKAGARGVPAMEWQTRCELAALYRLTVRYRMSDLVDGFIGARVAGESGALLVKPYGFFNEEVSASSLVKVDFDGHPLDGSNQETNVASVRMCAAIFEARAADNFVLHAHTRATMAVGAIKGGLLPISQPAFQFYQRLGYSAFEFDATEEFCERLLRDLGHERAMIMLNHGLMTVGRTAGEAFFLAYTLNSACEVQIAAQNTGRELIVPSREECEALAGCYESSELYEYDGSRQWPGFLRLLEREDPSYRT